jgi:sigma-B regulation protein RsbU (phosphoserine phosphatase)
MKIIHGIRIGGLHQKIFNLMLLIIAVLIGLYTAFYFYQQKELTQVVQEASVEQQASITAVSEETMAAVLNTSLTRTTALQAYIADDLFADVETDVQTLQAFAAELFARDPSLRGLFEDLGERYGLDARISTNMQAYRYFAGRRHRGPYRAKQFARGGRARLRQTRRVAMRARCIR